MSSVRRNKELEERLQEEVRQKRNPGWAEQRKRHFEDLGLMGPEPMEVSLFIKQRNPRDKPS
jgi:hypothetical protein